MDYIEQKSTNSKAKCQICNCSSVYRFYGVISCEGCKQFFRRIVIKEKMYFCWKQENCDTANGARCRGCRLNKALLLGMNPRFVNNKNKTSENFLKNLEQRRAILLQRQFMTNLIAESDNEGMLKMLMHLEDCLRRVWDSGRGLPAAYLHRHERIGDLLEDSENFLATAKFKYQQPIVFWDEWRLIWQIENYGIFSSDITNVNIKDWFLCVEFAKALPFFRRLEIDDQICVLRSIVNPIVHFRAAYYANKISAKTFTRSDGYKQIALLKANRFKGDKKLESMCVQLFCDPIQRVAQVDIDYGEFVLMLAIMFANSVPNNMTAEGRDLLYSESICLTKALQRFTENKYGPSGGAQKFASLMSLFAVFFHAKEISQNIGTYLEVFYERKEPTIKFPKVIRSFV